MLKSLSDKRRRIIQRILMRKPYRDDVRLSIKLVHILMEAPEPILKEIDFDSKRGLSTDLDEIMDVIKSPEKWVYLRVRFPRDLVDDLVLSLKDSSKGFNQNIISALGKLLSDGEST